MASKSGQKKVNIPQKNNNLIFAGIGIVVLLIILFLLFGFKQTPIQSDTQKIIADSLPKVDCNIEGPGAALKMAMEKNDLIYCDCIAEFNSRENCKSNVKNSLYMNQAIASFNPALCDNISDPDVVLLCKTNATKATDQMKEIDSTFLAYKQAMGNNYDLAIQTLEEIVDKNANDIAALSSLAVAYANKALTEHKEDELLPKAFFIIDSAIALNSEYAELYRVKGFIYEVKKDFVLAIGFYSQALQKDPNYIPAYINRGHAYNKQGDPFAASADFEKAKKLDVKKEHTDVYAQLCRLYSTNDSNISAAIENCEIVVESIGATADNISGAYLTLSEIYMRINDYNNAYNQLEIAHTYFPTSPDVLTGLARYYNKIEDYASAEKYSRESISVDPVRAVSHKSLSYALYQQERLSEAEEMGLRGLSLIEADVSLLPPDKTAVRKDLYYILANIYHYKGDTVNENKYKQLGDNA